MNYAKWKKKAKQCRDCRVYFFPFGARRLNTCNNLMRSNQFSASLVPRIGKVASTKSYVENCTLYLYRSMSSVRVHEIFPGFQQFPLSAMHHCHQQKEVNQFRISTHAKHIQIVQFVGFWADPRVEH